MAEHDVGTPGADQVGQACGVALHRRDSPADVLLGRPAAEGSKRVRAGIDHRDAVALLSERDGEPTGAPAGVDHVEGVAPALRKLRGQRLGQDVPHDGRTHLAVQTLSHARPPPVCPDRPTP